MSNKKQEGLSHELKMAIAIGIFAIGLIGLIALIIFTRKNKNANQYAPADSAYESSVIEETSYTNPNTNTDNPSSESNNNGERSSENSTPIEESYTPEEYKAMVDDLRNQVNSLTDENLALKVQVYEMEAMQDSTMFDQAKANLIEAFKNYYDCTCNGAEEARIVREKYLVLLTTYLTENAYDAFFEDWKVQDILNGEGIYAPYEIDKPSEYEVNRRIEAIDIMCSGVNLDLNEANFCAIYKVSEDQPFDDTTISSWYHVYGKTKYNAEKNVWQIDEVYLFKSFFNGPSNEEALTKSTVAGN